MYRVSSILTTKRNVWMGVGSAIKKPHEGLELFNEWSPGWLNHSYPVIAADWRNTFEKDQIDGNVFSLTGVAIRH